jgi:hypothetical protein
MTSKEKNLASVSPTAVDAVEWLLHNGTVRRVDATPALLVEPIVDAEPFRRGAQYQNRHNQHGLYYWPRTRQLVPYESALEMASLVELDFAGEAMQVLARPFQITFRPGVTAGFHTPDFFAVHANGDQVVYDVKPSAFMSDRALALFAETERVCSQVGWRYVVVNESAPTREANLQYLRAARHGRCHPSPALFERLLDVFRTSRPLSAAAMLTNAVPALANEAARHLIWHDYLAVDLDDPIDFRTVARSTAKEGTCCA